MDEQNKKLDDTTEFTGGSEEKKDAASMVDSWLAEIMKKMDLPEDTDITSEATGEELPPVDNEELERIVQETLAEDWTEDTSQEGLDPTMYFPPQTSEKQEKAPETATQEETAGEPEPKDTTPAPAEEKARPKGQKGYGLWGIPHIISTVIWLVLILAIGVSLGRTVWLCAADLLALGKTGQAVSITIDVQDRMPDIAQKLEEAGMIEYPKLFEFFTKLTGKGDNILVGKIDFSEEMIYDYNALVNAMSFRGGARVTVDVMIPEGYNCAQIFALLEEKGVCSARSLEKYAAEGELETYWFLDGVERGHKYCLEGFLFPDTYEFYMNDEAGRVIHKLLNGFESRFSSRMIDKFVALNQATGLKLTLRDVVTMASIVEKEKASDPEGYDIASVFYNRLRNPGSYPFLQSDATIKYDVDFRSKGELITDAQINASPYNSYTTKGLPPGPIANPGLASLDAALDPNDTSYYFFIFDQSAGVHRFSRTLAEHNSWARKLGFS